MGSRGQSRQKKYASEDRRQREDAKREGARRGAKYYEYTDRKGNTTTGETGNERARGGTYRSKFDEDVLKYAGMSPEELERERDRLKSESDTANWGITRAAASRTASAVDQAAAADTQIARINQVLRRQGASVKRAQERAAKMQATRDRQAGNMPAGVRVTMSDGTVRYYAAGPGGMVTDQYGYPRSVPGGMKYNELVKTIRDNQGKSGVKIENISGGELKAMREARQEAERNKPDYEMGLGTPWGNKENRRAARASRLAGRVARRSR